MFEINDTIIGKLYLVLLFQEAKNCRLASDRLRNPQFPILKCLISFRECSFSFFGQASSKGIQILDAVYKVCWGILRIFGKIHFVV